MLGRLGTTAKQLEVLTDAEILELTLDNKHSNNGAPPTRLKELMAAASIQLTEHLATYKGTSEAASKVIAMAVVQAGTRFVVQQIDDDDSR